MLKGLNLDSGLLLTLGTQSYGAATPAARHAELKASYGAPAAAPAAFAAAFVAVARSPSTEK